jgi:hypothetical protein
MAEGGYRDNHPEVIMPFRKPGGDHQLPASHRHQPGDQ